jgi:hypothetical protein
MQYNTMQCHTMPVIQTATIIQQNTMQSKTNKCNTPA